MLNQISLIGKENEIWQNHTLILPRQDNPLGGPSLTTNTLKRDSVNSHDIQSLQTKQYKQ